MQIARVELTDGTETLAAQQTDGTFVRIDEQNLANASDNGDEVVEIVRWGPPIEPRTIICIGRNFGAHAAEQGADAPKWPIVFMKNSCAATGHLEPIRIPSVCDDEVDFEGELVVVIGKEALNVSKEEALNYVLGYTIGNDVSARMWQFDKGGGQWCRAKSFDSFAPMGPVMVTPDEFGSPGNVSIQTRLNGDIVQEGNTRDMIFDVPALISFLSQGTTLTPGTAILTGTPPGIGWARDPKLLLQAGDTVEVEIEGIGCLRNEVVKE